MSRFYAGAVAVLAIFLALDSALAQGDVHRLYGPDGVSPQAVKQGILGSCFFHASIASLARSNSDTLRDAIATTSDGSYLVRFIDGPPEQVYPQDVDYGRTHDYDGSEGNWVLVLMRAYAQRVVRLSLTDAIRKSTLIPDLAKPMALSWVDRSGVLMVAYDRAIRAVVRQDGVADKPAFQKALTGQLKALGIPDTEATMLEGFLDERGFFDSLAAAVQQNGEVFGVYKGMGQGGIPERVMQAFLGRGSTGIVATDTGMMETLRQVHAGNMALVAITWVEAPTPELRDKANDWWVNNHAYSVLDFDEATQNVKLRNPWGYHPGQDGTFTLPVATFLKAFQIYSQAEAHGQ